MTNGVPPITNYNSFIFDPIRLECDVFEHSDWTCNCFGLREHNRFFQERGAPSSLFPKVFDFLSRNAAPTVTDITTRGDKKFNWLDSS